MAFSTPLGSSDFVAVCTFDPGSESAIHRVLLQFDRWLQPMLFKAALGALIINPYDTEQFADAIRRALEMAPEERQERMGRMLRQVEENNIYRWAANFLAELTAVPIAQPPTQEAA